MLDESKLIFIVSQPRSGSTLLQAILSNHKKIDTISEPWLLLPLLSLYEPALIQAKYDYNLALDAFFDFQDKTGGRNIFNEEYKSFILNQYNKIQTAEGNLVIDKTPRYYEIFDKIYEFFPSAKFILLKRHPNAVLRSIMKTWDRFHFKELAQHHLQDIFKAPFLLYKWEEKYGQEKNVKVLKYEELVENPDREIKDLAGWLNINYSPEVLEYSDNQSFHGKYGDPIGVKNSSSRVKTDNNKWEKAIREKKYKDYLNGYGHFLGKEFLISYGYDNDIDYKTNLKFKLFKYYCFRSEIVKNAKLKDKMISFIIRNYYGEKI